MGQLYPLVYRLPAFVRDCHRRYGPVFSVRAGLERLVFVLGAELAEEVLLDKDKVFSTELGYRRLLPLFGRGLLQHDFEEHRHLRRSFQNAFKADALRGYVPTLAAVMGDEVQTWIQDRDFRLHSRVKSLLFRCSLATFFGVREFPEGERKRLEEAFVDALRGTVRIFDFDIPGFAMHKALRGRKVLRDYIGQLVQERGHCTGGDFLSRLCKEAAEGSLSLTHKGIVDHAGFMLLAAHDTTASLLHFAIYYLLRHPEWLEQVRSEIGASDVGDLTYENLQNLKVTGWVIDEVLRIHSATPALMRGTLREVELGGVSIPADSNLLLIMDFNHHAPEDWANPESFDPRRFASTEGEAHQFRYIPFGGGAHKCIGLHYARLQAALFIALFVGRYDFVAPAGWRPRFKYLPLMAIKDGLPLRLELRRS